MTNEEKAVSTDKTETTTGGFEAGNNITTTPLLESSRSERERMEKVLSELKKENDRREILLSNERMGGQTTVPAPEVKKEETAREYSQRLIKGQL